MIAAMASARSGAYTLLIERYPFIGGNQVAGLMICYNGFRNQRSPDALQTVKGIPAEYIAEIVRLGGTGADDYYKKALAYFALFQACIIKRPFNLFHRKNLYLRFSDVERNFGNKTTWDTPFELHFRQFIAEANQAVFSNGRENKTLNLDVFDVQGKFDLVYIDTPYISQKGVGVDYFDFYHFLEGLVNYSKWPELIDYRTKHRRLEGVGSVWADKNEIFHAFDRLFEKFKSSIMVISYRSDGIPSIDNLITLLKKYKVEVEELRRKNYKYVLSTTH